MNEMDIAEYAGGCDANIKINVQMGVTPIIEIPLRSPTLCQPKHHVNQRVSTTFKFIMVSAITFSNRGGNTMFTQNFVMGDKN